MNPSNSTRVDLGGSDWKLRCIRKPAGDDFKIPTFDTISSTIPGGVHTDLQRAGLILDPYTGTQELQSKWIQRCDWSFEKQFEIPAGSKGPFVIECRLDTVSRVLVNDSLIGSTDNEFRLYSFQIPPKILLESGKNKLVIEILSPVEYCIQRSQKFSTENGYTIPYSEYVNGEKHWNMIRKAGCSFGWDWGPCIPNMGINQVHLLTVPSAIAQTMKVTCKLGPTHQSAGIEATVYGIRAHDLIDVDAKLRIKKRDGTIFHEHSFSSLGFPFARAGVEVAEFDVTVFAAISKPDLWFPRGYGAQSLYTLEVVLSKNNVELSSISKQFGCRTVELVREKDSALPDSGESFYFKINGIPIYCKGANMIPIHVLPTNETVKEYKMILDAAVASNMNCLRVWGGGRYPPDEFYNLCDEKGLLLWHDLMFACSLYPADREFLDSVKEEVKYQIRRMSGHPSLLIYTYSNENEELIYNDWLKVGSNKERFFIDYVHLVCDTIHPIVLAEDPHTPSMPSSPSNGHNRWGNPARPDMGDIHYWGVWHGNKPFTAFTEIKPRFCSEFGFQSFPSTTTWKDLDPEEMQVNSPSVEFRQRSPLAGTKCIVEHMMRYFRFPSTFQNFVYLSQLVQALAIKTAVEHWRRLKPYCSGTLYWQLNDIWPGISWSSVEHSGKWKLLHHFAAQFYSDILVSTVEEGAGVDKKINVWITSDELSRRAKCVLRVDLVNIIGKTIASVSTKSCEIEPQSSSCVNCIPMKELLSHISLASADKLLALEDNCFLTLSLIGPSGQHLSSNTHFFAPPKRFTLPKCDLDVSVGSVHPGRIDLLVKAPALALFVTLECTNGALASGHFTENGFCMLPFEEKRLSFVFEASQHAPTAAEFKSSLKVMSLRDSY